MDTKKLRQKILDLAIHGKLVPQDPNDEPASVLLDRIRAEKELMIKDGKIKRSKKASTSSHTPHYEQVPFEVPESWVWTTISTFTHNLTYGTSEKSNSTGLIPVLRMGNINRKGGLDWDDLVFTSNKYDIIKYNLEYNDLLFNRTNSSDWVGKTAIYKGERKAIFAGYLIRLRTICINADYLNLVMNSSYHRDWCDEVKTDAVNQSNINAQKLSCFSVPIPPLAEQKRIVDMVASWLVLIDQIEQDQASLTTIIKQAKNKILTLAIHGKLVPQDPNDEPAIELLKRVNPNFTPCDNAHYTQLSSGWAVCRLQDIVDYEQPTDYIVSSTNYDDSYPTPVLTAGKSFIIGYTNDNSGIYQKLPCIIFDDFTTDSKYVNFRFKVKSSAMKILQVHKDVNIEYVSMYMSITRLAGDTHKRYWISEYSKLPIPLPPRKEQDRIVIKVKDLYGILDAILESL